MFKLTRRAALQSMGVAALAASFSRISKAAETGGAGENLNLWLDRLYGNAANLRTQRFSGLQWQEAMDQIFADTPLSGLQSRLDFGALSNQIQSLIREDQPEYFHRIELPGNPAPAGPTSREPHQVLITKVAYVRKGHSVPPHGHSNMVSAFLCLSGEFEVRLYDRLEESEEHMTVRQTTHESSAGPGTWSSISDYRDNVHWLTAKSDDCFLFTTKMLSLEENKPLNGRINIDLKQARSLGTATWRAPRISAARARELY